MSKVWVSVALGAVILLGAPGVSSAWPMHGGMPVAMPRGMPGVGSRMMLQLPGSNGGRMFMPGMRGGSMPGFGGGFNPMFRPGFQPMMAMPGFQPMMGTPGFQGGAMPAFQGGSMPVVQGGA